MNKSVDCLLLKSSEQAVVPAYAHPGDSGLDVFATVPFKLLPMERKLIKTGLSIAVPEGYEIQVRSRSGLALKKGLFVLNSPGTIDSCYRGEIGVILANFSDTIYFNDTTIAIAQLVLAPVAQINFQSCSQAEFASDNKSDRALRGFGSTGS